MCPLNTTTKDDEQKKKDTPVVDVDADDNSSQEEEEQIDDEQLEEYKEMVDDLGTFPDKVKINSLSMVAEDHAGSSRNAKALYNIILESLVSADVNCDRKLPLVYVVDSILKNVKGQFIPIVEQDASNWLPVVYDALPEEKRVKLEKVWKLWKNTDVFAKEKWEEMGKCFSGTGSKNNGNGSETLVDSELEKAGLSLGKDGRLTLISALRDSMQIILDEMQQEESEMEKVSLERLAVINVNLLIQIKEMAESSLKANSSSRANILSSLSSSKPTHGIIGDELSFLVETRTPETLERSINWEKISINQNMKDARDVIASLHHLVRESSNIEKRYTQTEAIEMTRALATASVTASILTSTLLIIKDASDNKNKKSKMAKRGNAGNGMSRTLAPNFLAIDKLLFTNDGIKKLNEVIIGLLYEVGLPFISSGDGRRFATQLELSKHLDALFKKGQLEKSIITTQERGWYDNDSEWSGGEKTQNDTTSTELDDGNTSGLTAGDDNANPGTITMPADESRDRCVICGINFQMSFDNDDGIYKYSNCQEIEVLNSEAAAKESDQMLVHVTCWRNLGSPELLTADQTLQDARIS